MKHPQTIKDTVPICCPNCGTVAEDNNVFLCCDINIYEKYIDRELARQIRGNEEVINETNDNE